MKMTYGVIMIALIAAPVAGVAQDQSAGAAATDITNRFVSAFNHRDAAGIATLFSDDGVRLGQNGALKGREAIGEDLETIFRAGPVNLGARLTMLLRWPSSGDFSASVAHGPFRPLRYGSEKPPLAGALRAPLARRSAFSNGLSV